MDKTDSNGSFDQSEGDYDLRYQEQSDEVESSFRNLTTQNLNVFPYLRFNRDSPTEGMWMSSKISNPGSSIYNDEQAYPTVEEMLSGSSTPAPIVTIFENHQQAIAHTQQLKGLNDDDMQPGIPTTNEQKRLLVAVLFKAFKCTAMTQNRDITTKRFEHTQLNDKIVEIRCWELLEKCIERSKQQSCLSRTYGGDPVKSETHPMPFSRRFDGIVQAIRTMKTLAKRIYEPPFFLKLVDNPYYLINQSQLYKATCDRQARVRREREVLQEKSIRDAMTQEVSGVYKHTEQGMDNEESPTSARRLSLRKRQRDARGLQTAFDQQNIVQGSSKGTAVPLRNPYQSPSLSVDSFYFAHPPLSSAYVTPSHGQLTFPRINLPYGLNTIPRQSSNVSLARQNPRPYEGMGQRTFNNPWNYEGVDPQEEGEVRFYRI